MSANSTVRTWPSAPALMPAPSCRARRSRGVAETGRERAHDAVRPLRALFGDASLGRGSPCQTRVTTLELAEAPARRGAEHPVALALAQRNGEVEVDEALLRPPRAGGERGAD